MAKKLKGFDFKRGSKNSYPWDQWLDGSVWSLEQGDDFDVDPARVQSAAYVAAKARGGRVHTQREGETTVIVQFYTDAE